MARRLRGLLIVLRVLSPILLVGGLALATWWMAHQVVESTRLYGDRLGAELEEIGRAVDEANDGLEAVGGFVVATAMAADSLLGEVADLADSVTIPLPQIEIPAFTIPVMNIDIDLPDFDLGTGELRIPIPGIEAIQDLADRLVEAGAAITEPIAKLAELGKVPPHLEQAAEDTVTYAGEIRSTMAGWLRAVLMLLLIGALLWLAAQARPITSELARGFGMLLGRKPPTPSRVAGLERRVADLQKELSRMR
ncbi:MAG: hypothetical protein KJ698_06665 [Actinobacteria bacterium]|nr:hypothetical protein [Actinomycetota bacterium]